MIEPYAAKKDVQPYYPAVVDIETDRRTGAEIAVTWAKCHAPEETPEVDVYASWDEFWPDYLEYIQEHQESRHRRLYAHNGGNFDWPHLIVWLLDHDFAPERIRVLMAGGMILGIDIRIRKGVVVHLRDSYRLLPESLAKLTKSFKVAHQKLDIQDQLHHELAETDRRLFLEYCVHDVLGLQEVLFSFWTMIYRLVGSIGELPMTLPALAMRLWRITAPESGIMTPRNKKLKAMERRAYSGGRTECFRVGRTSEVNVYDVNSLYPAVMQHIQVPAGYRGGFTRNYVADKLGLYDVTFQQTNTRAKPVLRDEASNDFAYSGAGVYTTVELDLLREVGGDFQIKEGYVFHQSRNLFADFITNWYGIRLQAQRNGDTGLSYVCKILMNSLYGKFGQKEEGWTLYLMPRDELIMRLQRGDQIREMGEFVLVMEERHNETTFVSIAAYITAAARSVLYGFIAEAERRGGYVWYCDTDSVHVSGAELGTSDDLGAVKHEYTGPASYAGKKLYALGDKLKHKGVGKKAGITAQQMADLVDGTIPAISATFETLPTAREILSRRRTAALGLERTRTLKVTGPPG